MEVFTISVSLNLSSEFPPCTHTMTMSAQLLQSLWAVEHSPALSPSQLIKIVSVSCAQCGKGLVHCYHFSFPQLPVAHHVV